MELLEQHRYFDGLQQRWRHDSTALKCPMTFSIFLPPPRIAPPKPGRKELPQSQAWFW